MSRKGTINGEPYEVPDGYIAVAEAEHHRWQAFAVLLLDLDRCEHGRHQGDVCSGCHGPSLGNPVFRGTGPRPFGYDLSGNLIVDPGRGQRYDPEAWRVTRTLKEQQ